MDSRLITWARQVKSRRRHGRTLPVLWLFSDPVRLPDLAASARRLPCGLCGIVLRHEQPAGGAEERAMRLRRGRALARICRSRRIALQVAGDRWLAQALGAGLHLRRGHGPARQPRPRLLTSSAHDGAELRRARRAGAALVFLSPCFPTLSHPGAAGLRPRGWTALALRAGLPVAALGGIDGDRIRALPRVGCVGAGAIGALARDGKGSDICRAGVMEGRGITVCGG